jgi:type IV pilus assembly protein PilE
MHAGSPQGVTLIELIVVVAILAIVVGVGYPVMTDYVQKSRRSEAKAALQDLALRQERWRVNQTSYASSLGNLTGLSPDISGTIPDDYYTYSVTGGTTTYAVQAAAKAGTTQENDATRSGASCSTLSIDESENKTPAACW